MFVQDKSPRCNFCLTFRQNNNKKIETEAIYNEWMHVTKYNHNIIILYPDIRISLYY